MPHTYPTIPPCGFLRLPQVLALFPISKSAWWQGCKDGRYPKVWRAEDIRAFIERVSREGISE